MACEKINLVVCAMSFLYIFSIAKQAEHVSHRAVANPFKIVSLQYATAVEPVVFALSSLIEEVNVAGSTRGWQVFASSSRLLG